MRGMFEKWIDPLLRDAKIDPVTTMLKTGMFHEPGPGEVPYVHLLIPEGALVVPPWNPDLTVFETPVPALRFAPLLIAPQPTFFDKDQPRCVRTRKLPIRRTEDVGRPLQLGTPLGDRYLDAIVRWLVTEGYRWIFSVTEILHGAYGLVRNDVWYMARIS